MRKDFGQKPWIYPMPVLIIGTYDENGVPNAMNAAWGGISCDTEIMMCLSEGHKTTKNILDKKEFTVSFANVENMIACDYVGISSGNETMDKVAKAGLTPVKAAHVDAPYFEQLPMTLECKLISYDPETCHLFGEIMNVCADESILTDDKIDAEKLHPITYDPVSHQYREIGKAVGMAFSEGKKIN